MKSHHTGGGKQFFEKVGNALRNPQNVFIEDLYVDSCQSSRVHGPGNPPATFEKFWRGLILVAAITWAAWPST